MHPGRRVDGLAPVNSSTGNRQRHGQLPAGSCRPDSGATSTTYFPAYRQWEFFAFARDKWQVSPKLTLDLGLRWEFYPPATPAFPGGFSNYDPINNTLVMAGVGGNPIEPGHEEALQLLCAAHRTGLPPDEQTVIRAGFGISYTPFPDNTYAYNYPVKQNNQYSLGANAYAPGVTPERRVLHGERLPGAPVGRDSLQRDHHQPVADAEQHRDSD